MNPTLENQLTIRTPQMIAIEINYIKDQTRKMVLSNSIEIGRRLIEAKAVVDHGQWGEWLEKSVDYSQRTATNLMRICEEYGQNSNSQAFANLNYSQAVALLGIAPEERGKFVQSNPVSEMSTRELQQAIKDKEQAEKEKQELEHKLKAAEKKVVEEQNSYQRVSESYKILEEVNRKHFEQVKSLKKELDVAKASGNADEVERLQKSLNKADQELETSNRKIKELEHELKEKPIDVTTATIEKVPEAVEQELAKLRKKNKELEIKADQQNNAAIAKFTVYFDTLVKDFGNLIGALAEFKDTDPEAHEKYKNAVTGLFGKMSERL